MIHKISWTDSAGQPSTIHATADGTETICGGHAFYIRERELTKAPKRKQGRSNYCPECFSHIKKSVPWDERCRERV